MPNAQASSIYSLQSATIEEIRAFDQAPVHTCTLSVKVQRRRNQQQHFCTATILSQKQIVTNDACLKDSKVVTYPRRLICNGGTFEIPLIKSNYKSNRTIGGLNLIDLGSPLPVMPPTLHNKKIKSLAQFKECSIETANKSISLYPRSELTYSLGNKSIRLTKKLPQSAKGASIICTNRNGDQEIIGLYDKDNNFTLLSSIKNEIQNKIDNEQYVLKGDDESLKKACEETGTCIENISKDASLLTKDILAILNALTKEYNESFERDYSDTDNSLRESEITNLYHEYTEMRLACHKLSQDVADIKNREIDSDWIDNTLGSIEGGAISFMDGLVNTINITPIDWDYDFLQNQFKGVGIISENLSEDEFKKIYDRVDQQHKGSNLEKIKVLTSTFASKVVENIATKMNVFRYSDEEEKDEFLKNNLIVFKECVSNSVSKDTVLACADKLSQKATINIAKKELDNQLIDNFDSLFSDESQKSKQTLSLLKKEAEKTYFKCVENYLSKNIDKDINSDKKAQACVYDAILTAFKITREQKVQELLLPLISNEIDYQVAMAEIMHDSKRCHFGHIINTPRQIDPKGYRTLAKIQIPDFKNHISTCVENLSITAGRYVAKESIAQHKDVMSLVSDHKKRDRIVSSIMNKEYNNCIETMRSTPNTIDPERCRDYLTAMTTIDVATEVIFDSTREMYLNIDTEDKSIESRTDSINKEIQKEINTCRNEVQKHYIDLLKNKKNSQNEKEILACLSNGIGKLARSATMDTIRSTLKSDPTFKNIEPLALNNKVIKALPQQTENCFKEEIRAKDKVSEFTSDLDNIKARCTLKTEKIATKEIALLAIEDQLSQTLNDDKLTQIVLSSFSDNFEKEVKKAQSKNELERIVNHIIPDVTLLAAREIIPTTTKEFLKDKSPEEKSRINGLITSNLESCIHDLKKKENVASYSEEVDSCVNSSTRSGYQEIALSMMNNIIDQTLTYERDNARDLKENINSDLTQCLNDQNLGQKTDSYKSNLDNCISDQVFEMSFKLPKEAIVQYMPLLRSQLKESEIRKMLKDIEDFYLLGNKSKMPQLGEHPSLVPYSSLMTCLVAKRYSIRKENITDLDQVQKTYKSCTDDFEKNMREEIARSFASAHAKNDQELRATLLRAGRTIVMLSGNSSEDDTNTKDQSADNNTLEKTKELMDMLGEKIATSCRFNYSSCQKSIARTHEIIETHTKENNTITAEELKNIYIDSPILKDVIKSELAMTLKMEMQEGLKEFNDREGILKDTLNEITSSTMINQLLSTPVGKDLSDAILEAIKNDQLEEIVKDPKFLQKLSEVLTYNTGNDSFVDKLLNGLVQPTLNREKETSKGLFGIFKNTKVSIGRLLRIVKGRNFKWEKIRTTRKGKAAQKYFAKEVFAPIIRGENLDSIKDKKGKSDLDKRIAHLEELIVEGLKDL